MANATKIDRRFSARTQQCIQELLTVFREVNEKSEQFRKESQANIRRVTFNLILSVKNDGVVMTESEAAVFISDLADMAGGGYAKFLSNSETAQSKRILQCSIEEFKKAREVHKGSDLKVLSEACPRVSTKGRKAKPKAGENKAGENKAGETAPENKAGETAPENKAGETVPARNDAFNAAIVVLRSRLDFLLQITAKNKGQQWTAAHASAKAASEAFEALGLYPTK